VSEFARFGAIWATKALVSKLSGDERQRIDFGVSRDSPTGQQHFVAASYAQVSSLINLGSGRYEKLRDIANLPVTEIRSVDL
jgi:adenylate cyclase